MSQENVLFEVCGRGVATLTLNRAALHNAFDDAFINQFIHILKKISQDNAIKLVVLKAAGKSFCAGADLSWMQRMVNYSYKENCQDADQLAELMYQLANLPQPTLAVIQGAAYGGGVGLVACCDLVIAQQDAKFCLSEVKLGLMPAVIAPYVLAKLGLKTMQRYALTADIFDADEAKRINLVDEVVSMQELASKAEAWIQTLLKNSPVALQKLKALLAAIREPKAQELIRKDTVEAIAKQRISEEGQEGLKAFLEKRKPSWCKE